MKEIELLFKDFTLWNILLFLFYTGLILFVNWLIKGIAKVLAIKRPKLNKRYIPAVNSLINWITFYSIILLFITYFSETDWMFKTLYSKGEVKVTFFLIITAFMIVSFANRIVKLFTKYVLTNFYEHYNIDRGLGYTISQMIYYVVMIAALAFSFTRVGIDLTALGAVFGVLGIGIGFGMRNVAGNFVSGIIMLFERPVEVGEVIEIDDKIGRVEKIRLRSTLVRTAKEGNLIIPNQYFIEHIIKNRTTAEMRALVKVSVSYGEDSKIVQRLLEEAVDYVNQNCAGILESPHQEIRFVDFRNSAMDFMIELPVTNFEIKERVESELRHSIASLLNERGIKMPAIVTEAEKES
ncbi:mechanosensitive ion channel protein MscS [Neobacillus notoginsengisoli]|uniref:Mechanosensitive ion channel protein MscS n=1 Tax=Neobacillus notoginsengisoli TaxID=1578198 RepID=A0A417YX35_9BACI|nr:mechanosensitive ion channel domain-containing protein [Neobacillus notoginsengisoli]RHW42121.1 mechanosensitive ion channel protein MscS [Neobacillus notoginsengisoli]